MSRASKSVLPFLIAAAMLLLASGALAGDGGNDPTPVTRGDLNRLWVLVAACLVFFMQAGFKCF